jgi:hypothetical protein
VCADGALEGAREYHASEHGRQAGAASEEPDRHVVML